MFGYECGPSPYSYSEPVQEIEIDMFLTEELPFALGVQSSDGRISAQFLPAGSLTSGIRDTQTFIR